MPRGAKTGNQNARKAQKREGVTISLYIDAYSLEFLQAACQSDGLEPTPANARKRAKLLAIEAIKRDVRQTFFKAAQQ